MLPQLLYTFSQGWTDNGCRCAYKQLAFFLTIFFFFQPIMCIWNTGRRGHAISWLPLYCKSMSWVDEVETELLSSWGCSGSGICAAFLQALPYVGASAYLIAPTYVQFSFSCIRNAALCSHWCHSQHCAEVGDVQLAAVCLYCGFPLDTAETLNLSTPMWAKP